jgi:outer membrane protein OmpA-like peptidoglycan-associated protein
MTDDPPLRPRPLSSDEAEAYRLQALPESAGTRDLHHDERRPGPGPTPDWSRQRPDDDSGPPRAAWLVGILAVAACVLLGVVYFVVSGDSQEQIATQVGDASDSPGGGEPAATSATGIAVDSSAATGQPEPSQAGPSSGQELTGTMLGDQVVVAGTVPTTQASAGLVLLLEQVVGVGNVDTSALMIDAGVDMPSQISLIVGNEVVFAPSSDELEPEFRTVLDNVASLMNANADVTAVIEGHADADGSRSQNLSLSQRRADAVVDYLVGKGIERVRMVAVGRGSEEPIADNSTAEGRKQNRRIEFVIVGFRLNL